MLNIFEENKLVAVSVKASQVLCHRKFLRQRFLFYFIFRFHFFIFFEKNKFFSW